MAHTLCKLSHHQSSLVSSSTTNPRGPLAVCPPRNTSEPTLLVHSTDHTWLGSRSYMNCSDLADCPILPRVPWSDKGGKCQSNRTFHHKRQRFAFDHEVRLLNLCTASLRANWLQFRLLQLIWPCHHLAEPHLRQADKVDVRRLEAWPKWDPLHCLKKASSLAWNTIYPLVSLGSLSAPLETPLRLVSLSHSRSRLQEGYSLYKQ